MPDIDGFETASLIRKYKKSAHTPIIFITAYADEMQTSQGYSLGAVDYILSPILPDVLRSKVKVFVELHQMQQRTRLMAEERIALAHAEAARSVAEEATLRSAFLARASRELGESLDLEEGMRRLVGLVVPRFAEAARWMMESGRRSRWMRAGMHGSRSSKYGGMPPRVADGMGGGGRLCSGVGRLGAVLIGAKEAGLPHVEELASRAA